ncbi:MAG TPA: YtxH domain-containing protein [Anaerolineales bacterium]
MKGFFSFLSGALTGAVVGAALALLLAPDSGEDLRQQLQDRRDQIQVEVKQAAANRRAELEQQLAVLRSPRKQDAA